MKLEIDSHEIDDLRDQIKYLRRQIRILQSAVAALAAIALFN